MPLIYRVCKWLDDDEFKRLLRFSDYLGRRNGCSVFTIKYSMIRSPRLQDYVETVEEVGGEFDEESRRELERLIEEYSTVMLSASKQGFILRSRQLLSELLSRYRALGHVRYSRELQGFIVKPYVVLDVVSMLEAAGFKVKDETCLLRCDERLSIEFSGELRSYQREALESWMSNGYRGVVALPTGSGKTIVALAAIALLRRPTLVIVYTREQLMEWVDKISRFLNLHPSLVGRLYSAEKKVSSITVATYQSALRNMDALYDRFSLLVVDEAHHLPADKFRLIAEHVLAPYRLALSATPYREDGRHNELFMLMGGIVYEKSVQELEEKGFIASYTIIPRLVDLAPDEKQRFREMRKRYLALARGRKVQELVKAVAAGDESARKALQLLNQMRRLLALSRSKIEETRAIIESELSRGSKIIVFTQFVEQAEALGKRLGVPVVTGRTEQRRRRLIFNLFKSGRYRVLVLTTVGDEGIDVPDANVGVILSGTSSKRQFIQRLGRLLRPAKGKSQAKLYYVAVRGTQEEATLRKLLREIEQGR